MSAKTTLGDACVRVDYGLTTSATHGGEGPRFLRITDIERSHVDWTSVPFCSATPRELDKYALGTGDVVVARTGASTGRSQWVQVSEPAVFASYLVRFRAGPDLSSRYLGYVLASRPWHSYVSSVAHGKSAQPNMSASDMAAFSFALPRLTEQRAIAEVLGALDDKIAANDRLVSTADELAEALAFSCFDSGASSLSEQAIVTMGSSPPGASYNETRQGVSFYQGVRDFGVRFPKNRVWTTAPVRVAASGDTLVSVRAPVGRTNLANEDLCLGRGLAGLRSRDEKPMSLFHQVRAAEAAWAPYQAEGTVFGSINKKQLESVQVPIVRSGAEDALEDQLRSLEDRIAAALDESESLAATRDELLPLLMSGRVRVPDAEKVVEGVL